VSVVVSNPSSNPEMAHAASALAARHSLARYNVPIAVGQRSVRRIERLPHLGAPIAREARRRLRPPGLARSDVSHTATASDVLRVMMARGRLPPAAQSKIAEYHRVRFDRSVAARLRPSDEKVVAVQGSALSTLCRARQLGIISVLDATLAHPGFLRKLIAREVMLGDPVTGRSGVELLPPGFTERRIEELALADRILVPSSFARQTHLDGGVDPNRIKVVPLGVDTDIFTPSSRPREDGRFRALFVGRLTRLKGVPYLVNAFTQARIPGAELMLVGDSTYADPAWLRNPGIRYLPPIPRFQLPSVFRSADVFVMPSLAESYGLVALEAMASAVPVIVSSNSIGPDVIEQGVSGYIVRPGDTDDLARCLRLLAQDGERRKRMGSAAAHSAKRFTWSAYESAFIRAIDE
jgi:glycosyltransferase involved in cell wall biosynthesis